MDLHCIGPPGAYSIDFFFSVVECPLSHIPLCHKSQDQAINTIKYIFISQLRTSVYTSTESGTLSRKAAMYKIIQIREK
jgi:hypothetical protein